MEKLNYRYLFVALLMAVTGYVIDALSYTYSGDDKSSLGKLRGIPLKIGQWQGRDFDLEEIVYDILETKSIIHRSYTRDDGGSVFLSIVYYHDTKVDFHAPESCFGGRGLKVKKENIKVFVPKDVQETPLNIAQIISKKDDRETLTYYFYRTGTFVGSSYIQMRLNIAINKLLNNDTSGMLVRISTAANQNDRNEGKSLLLSFLEDIWPYIQLEV